MSSEDPFGFSVEQVREGEWTVYLPHQCDRWAIAGGGYASGVPQAEALEELDQFIVQAQEACAALARGEEIRMDD